MLHFIARKILRPALARPCQSDPALQRHTGHEVEKQLLSRPDKLRALFALSNRHCDGLRFCVWVGERLDPFAQHW